MMSEDAEDLDDRLPRFKFSLASVFLLVLALAMLLSLATVYRQLRNMDARLAAIDAQLEAGRMTAIQPILPTEVARQFERYASTQRVQVKVNDVRYSAKDDAYKVEFSWADPTSKTNWSTEVLMKSDGFGRYYGPIRSSEYLKAIGSSLDSYLVLVQSGSPLEDR